MKNVIWVLFVSAILFSCQKDISGTYKALHPTESFEKEIIEIEGNRFTRTFYGKTSDQFHDKSRGKWYYILCTFPYTMQYQCSLNKDGDKYTAKLINVDVNIDKDEFKSSCWQGTNISNDSLIRYYKDYLLDTINGVLDEKKQEYDELGIQFVVKENKLILVGGNEVDDYYIKLVE